MAACGLAFLISEALLNITVIRQSRRGTNFDYWLGEQTQDLLLQDKAKLEISGIRAANTTAIITTRLRQKLKQINNSTRDLPAYVLIVEFSRPIVYIEKL